MGKLNTENFFGTETKEILASAGAVIKGISTPESRKKFKGQATFQVYLIKDGKSIFEGNFNSMVKFLNSVAILIHSMRKKIA